MLAQIREAIATQLANLEVPDLSVYAEAPGAINPPAAIVVPDQPVITYNSGMGARSDYNLLVVILVAKSDTQLSQSIIDPYLDPHTGVPGVVGKSLDGLVSFCRVTACRNYGEVTYASAAYLGADFPVRVTA